jgi:hypothetical protein
MINNEMKKIKLFLITILIIGSSFQTQAQLTSNNRDPEEAQIVYDDILNFIDAFKMLKSSTDTLEVIQRYYIDKGTPGLKIYIEKYELDASSLTKAIRKNPEDYKALGERLTWLKSQEDSIRFYFHKLKQFIPNAVFPPTYYLVGQRWGVGSGSIEGQLITIEKKAVDIVDPGLKTHIIHELVHLNQLQAIGSLKKYLAIYNDEKSLLAISLREGVAEFFAELITGEYTQNEAREYVLKNERKIWERFRMDMLGIETKDWMWKKPKNPEQPRDIGYVIGALIVEYYYKHATNLDQAIQEILAITDYKAFLDKSQYSNRFNN